MPLPAPAMASTTYLTTPIALLVRRPLLALALFGLRSEPGASPLERRLRLNDWLGKEAANWALAELVEKDLVTAELKLSETGLSALQEFEATGFSPVPDELLSSATLPVLEGGGIDLVSQVNKLWEACVTHDLTHHDLSHAGDITALAMRLELAEADHPGGDVAVDLLRLADRYTTIKKLLSERVKGGKYYSGSTLGLVYQSHEVGEDSIHEALRDAYDLTIDLRGESEKLQLKVRTRAAVRTKGVVLTIGHPREPSGPLPVFSDLKLYLSGWAFSRRQAARLIDLSAEELLEMEERGLIRSIEHGMGHLGNRRLLSFEDLAFAAFFRQLQVAGLPLELLDRFWSGLLESQALVDDLTIRPVYKSQLLRTTSSIRKLARSSLKEATRALAGLVGRALERLRGVGSPALTRDRQKLRTALQQANQGDVGL